MLAEDVLLDNDLLAVVVDHAAHDERRRELENRSHVW
jgi:hypothetical protein